MTNPPNTRLNLSYQYFANGNIQQINDATRSEVMNYTYDNLDRLLSVSGAYTQNFGYNSIGNLTNKAGVTLSYGAQSAVTPRAILIGSASAN